MTGTMRKAVLSLLAAGSLASPLHAGLYQRQDTCPATQPTVLTPIPILPDPFTVDGVQITTKEQWQCRQAQLSALFQQYELGALPGAPDALSSVYSNGTLAITATVAGTALTYNVKVSIPANAASPAPAMIVYDGASIPVPDTVATITFGVSQFAIQNDASSRNTGQFYTLYPNATAGALTAWAWGVSRIIDSLTVHPEIAIDATRIGVTGCSRNGKGAFVAGALEPRIALTIPQESGSGGAACWRLSDDMYARGEVTQTLDEIVGENVWYSTAFNQFAKNNTNNLPFDHHELAGLVSPRGLLVIENTDYLWLGPESSLGCMTAGRRAYTALGETDSMGFSQVGGHAHCSFPDDQLDDLNAFINRFLLDEEADTDIFRTVLNTTFDAEKWAPWSTPALV